VTRRIPKAAPHRAADARNRSVAKSPVSRQLCCGPLGACIGGKRFQLLKRSIVGFGSNPLKRRCKTFKLISIEQLLGSSLIGVLRKILT
jgi:hypothetical protein